MVSLTFFLEGDFVTRAQRPATDDANPRGNPGASFPTQSSPDGAFDDLGDGVASLRTSSFGG